MNCQFVPICEDTYVSSYRVIISPVSPMLAVLITVGSIVRLRTSRHLFHDTLSIFLCAEWFTHRLLDYTRHCMSPQFSFPRKDTLIRLEFIVMQKQALGLFIDRSLIWNENAIYEVDSFKKSEVVIKWFYGNPWNVIFFS